MFIFIHYFYTNSSGNLMSVELSVLINVVFVKINIGVPVHNFTVISSRWQQKEVVYFEQRLHFCPKPITAIEILTLDIHITYT